MSKSNTTQIEMPFLSECPRVGTRWPGGWVRADGGGSKLSAVYLHVSGWRIEHCGHPTANWPYSLVDPEHPDCVTTAHNGRGFRTLVDARVAVHAVLDGRMVTDGTVGGGRRVVPAVDVIEAAA